MEQPPEKRNPAASLTDDLLVEILRRVPVRSLCRFKCVSRSWRKLISDPVHRKKLHDRARSVFLNSFMHTLTFSRGIALVDMEGKTWRTIPVPSDRDSSFIDQAQGRLFYLNVDDADAFKLSIWILEDHGTNEWTLKHSVRTNCCFGGRIFDLRGTSQ
ncbi:hypothetical protein C2845_PM01G18960 [Panicum miliaceum]|uniref:F-box domain-containing protein n=1 Tax=Panicum miliaceum TaxID=4540 RepID=A0A3L6TVR1_PANMI|nr:hypothetical protein C2845_PM01G18960 [Panicum miliaceum]